LDLFRWALLGSLVVLAGAATAAGFVGWWVGDLQLDLPNIVHLALAGLAVVVTYVALLFPFRRRLMGTASVPAAE
jgi:hypothetical protein